MLSLIKIVKASKKIGSYQTKYKKVLINFVGGKLYVENKLRIIPIFFMKAYYSCSPVKIVLL